MHSVTSCPLQKTIANEVQAWVNKLPESWLPTLVNAECSAEDVPEISNTDFTDLMPFVCEEWKEVEPIQGDTENQIYTAAGKFRPL